MAHAGSAGDDDLVAMIDEIRAILADHDLSAVRTEPAPEGVEPEPEVAHPAPPALVGARFAGAGERVDKRPRRSRFGSR